MKILYFEAQDGISGDMTLGALIDLGADVDAVKAELDKFVPEPYGLIPHSFARNGIHGVNLDVMVDEHTQAHDHGEHGHSHPHGGHGRGRCGGGRHRHGGHGHTHSHGEHAHEHPHGEEHSHDHDSEHTHRSYAGIRRMIEDSGITPRAKSYALSIFAVIAKAEAAVHAIPESEVAFHEVGAMDSIIDIVGTAIAVDLLDVEGFFTSELHDGSGEIVCRHGRIPVPVPAVMEMAKGSDIPIHIEAGVKTEMITPTGFGIIKGLNCKYSDELRIKVDKVGYGFGKRNTGRLGALRVILGRLAE